VSSPSLEDLLARLERERVEADRLYNDALTAVDRAIQSAPALPGHPPPYDAAKVEAINQSWDILPAGSPAIDRSLRGRLRGFIWRLIGPSLETQKQFNAALVEHLNRNVSAHEESQRATAALIDAAREQFQALTRFESLLVQYLQTVTLYVDTKDRAAGGNELRERITLIEQRIAAMKRALDAEAASAHGASASRAPRAESVFSTDLDSVTYVGFEDKFRGSQADIRSRIEDYVPMFASASNVLDVGCGRGELLDLLRSRGVSARGIDVNRAMVDICRERGLAVEQADAVSYLGGQADASLGGLIALQVVEHFEPAYLLHFLELAHHKMQPGAPLVLETINPACWMAFFETYIRDLTHQRPLHPDTLRYLVQASGFTSVDVQFRAPVTEGDRLERIAADATIAAHAGLARVAAVVNAHADTLNARLFSSMDYAVIARR
jgi:2-polyprenyl-3-methyl-5-hydroxy-6-metoxy-1,4-benzoquinol methylase